MRLALDPGHGGRDRGATRGLFEESTFNLMVAELLASELYRSNWPVELSLLRSDDLLDPTLERRSRHAFDFGADLVLSIHANASTEGAYGPVAFAKPGDALGLEVSRTILADLPRPTSWRHPVVLAADDRLWPRAANVVHAYHGPVVLIECGYATWEPDRLWMMSRDGLDEIVSALAAGVGRALFLRGELGD
jgi:N-acetylmuramoyl-L-alanine amidase